MEKFNLPWYKVLFLTLGGALALSGTAIADKKQDKSNPEPKTTIVYKVLPEDNLTKIAGQYKGVSITDILDANPDIKNPNLIHKGQEIKIPKIIDSIPKKTHTLDDYIKSIFTIESNNNPNASRYEPHINDTSYGLGQILTRTAKALEARHKELPRLGKSKQEIAANLCNPKINEAYTRALYQKELDFYKDPFLAVAAYNSGHLTPRNARIQEMLNQLYNTELKTDGRIGPKSKEVVKRFQEDNGLKVDGIVGNNTYTTLNKNWQEKFPEQENPIGIIPDNRYTPNHVRKFENVLK